ncbi:MAG: bis(5'-nucleosyl)-tetraphosphatase (symmetrical) YqeK [Clostridia bacterium]|nr:bis(5'-nucleosyl)-tetraphosphatase (symmetrical) YqeK [Clostridia bacterium]
MAHIYGKYNSYEEIEAIVKTLEKEKRFNHSLGVVEVSIKLANLYGCDVEKARVSAILHDCAKNLSDEKINEFCTKYNLDFSYLDLYPNILHSHLGSLYAKYEFGIDDEDILSAIKYHTTGKADMSLLEKIIFLADFLDPGRDTSNYQETFDKANKLVYENIDEGLKFVLQRTIFHLEYKGVDNIHPDTKEAYDFYCFNS